MALAVFEKPLSDFKMSDVKLLDCYTQNAFALEVKYLKSLDFNRLLKGFCEIGGVESDAVKYGGWETSAIQGHTLGHYLAAVSQGYATSSDQELKAISDKMIRVLSRCQNKDTGYLAAIDEDHYHKLEKGETEGTWVPWYSMHKILSGLVKCYELTDNKEALLVASRLGDWVYSHTSKWDTKTQKAVLNIEYGGMNDCLYQLYKNTGSEKHLSAAHSFDELTLFDALYNNEDVLDGKHANTTIPKIIGALNRYTVTGEEYYLQVAVNFWKMVIEHHTYITGGNSEWEHFGKPYILDGERTNCNCETCNTYNMLKLTRELYKLTGESKYADYYENTFINAILSSQNSETGMTTYFQPMATGYFKVYSSADQHFWCCTGSGMESFSKLGDSIYYKDDNSLYVTQFTSSSVNWIEKGLKITQKTDLPRVKITVEGSKKAKIILRVPDWCVGEPILKINGDERGLKVQNGLIVLDGEWQSGDIIEYYIPMGIKTVSLPDNENTVAFKYGPWVLSADMGKKAMDTTTTGVNVTIPLFDEDLSGILKIENGTIKEWIESIDKNLLRKENTMEFELKGTNQPLVFSPHYKQHQSRYGIYFTLSESNGENI